MYLWDSPFTEDNITDWHHTTVVLNLDGDPYLQNIEIGYNPVIFKENGIDPDQYFEKLKQQEIIDGQKQIDDLAWFLKAGK